MIAKGNFFSINSDLNVSSLEADHCKLVERIHANPWETQIPGCGVAFLWEGFQQKEKEEMRPGGTAKEWITELRFVIQFQKHNKNHPVHKFSVVPDKSSYLLCASRIETWGSIGAVMTETPIYHKVWAV